MDTHNLCQTPTTYRLLRLEYLLGLIACSALFLTHLGEVRWWAVVALFTYIDLIGYLPGYLAYRRSPDKRIHRAYYVLYNTMHSLAAQAVVVAVWIWLAGPEWALLAVPIHLFGDRGLFGNFPKSFTVSFEPLPHPAIQSAQRDFAKTPWHAWEPGAPATAEGPERPEGREGPDGPDGSAGSAGSGQRGGRLAEGAR